MLGTEPIQLRMTVVSKLLTLSTVIKTVTVVGGVIAFSLWYRTRRTEKIRVVVCSLESEWEEIADEFRKSLSHGMLGLDCEWVSTKRDHRVALLQMAGNSELCVLIRLCRMKAPKAVREILADPTIIKFGVAIQDDAKRLWSDYGIKASSPQSSKIIT